MVESQLVSAILATQCNGDGDGVGRWRPGNGKGGANGNEQGRRRKCCCCCFTGKRCEGPRSAKILCSGDKILCGNGKGKEGRKGFAVEGEGKKEEEKRLKMAREGGGKLEEGEGWEGVDTEGVWRRALDPAGVVRREGGGPGMGG